MTQSSEIQPLGSIGQASEDGQHKMQSILNNPTPQDLGAMERDSSVAGVPSSQGASDPIDFDKLEEVARAAMKEAPGNWESDSIESDGGRGKFSAYHVLCDKPNPYAKRGWSAIVDTHNSEIICEHEDEDSRWDEPGRIVTEHIATFDPPTILSLLSRLKEAAGALQAAQARIKVLEEALEPFAALADRFGDLADQELSVVRAGPRQGNAKLSDVRQARSALLPKLGGENG